jgi:aldehyde:ferredoxin oxidoreductase
MLKGYMGTIARVDLTNKKINYEPLNDELARKYLGGVGLAAKILWDETGASTEPFSPENPLVFMTGPLTGTNLPKSSRYILAGLSPLTGIWGQAHGGGSFPDELKHGGFDGIVIEGESESPVYLWVHDGKIEVRDATHLWGKDAYETGELVRKETEERASPACIGQAGEKLVRFASVMSDGKDGRAAARCGLGALMGSKRLKAVVARGTQPVRFHNEEKFNEGVKRILTSFPIRKSEEAHEAHMAMFRKFFTLGRVPVKNFSQGSFEAGLKYVEDMRHARQFHCKHCPYDCTESYLTPEGERHMVWEAWGPLGTNCLIDDPKTLQQAYALCNRYGMDAISIGVVMSFAMECFEKGLITKEDTDGIELRWGNGPAMVEMVRRIGERKGLGELLGEGVKRAAERIGGRAQEYAMHVKGMELPAHEPRAANGTALGYATGSIGAAHMEASGSQNLENWLEVDQPRTFPEIGFPVALTRFDVEGKGAIVAKTQDFGCLLDSITVCLFLSLHQWVQPSHYAELINHAVGWDMDREEFLRTGERIFNLKRMFSVRRGISRKDDALPPRILTHRLTDGGTKGNLPFLGLMLNEYYLARGWNEEGIPTREKLSELDLKECL